MTESAYNYSDMYEELGIRIPDLGCIMADLEPIPVMDIMTGDEDDLYVSQHPDRTYILGDVGSQKAHLTLLYGLLKPGKEWKGYVDRLLEDIDLSTVTVDYVDMFDSPFEDEPYKCVVAHLKITPEIQKAHARLEYLPHINTFLDYKAHVTLAYVHEDAASYWAKWLNDNLAGNQLKVTGINYGGRD